MTEKGSNMKPYIVIFEDRQSERIEARNIVELSQTVSLNYWKTHGEMREVFGLVWQAPSER